MMVWAGKEFDFISRTLQRLVFFLLFFLVLNGILLLFLEVYLRFNTFPTCTPGYTVTHPLRRYTLKPGFKGWTYTAELIINSNGIRDYEKSLDNQAFRIAVFGDSITFGIGVPHEKTFSKLLESKLNGRFQGNPEFQIFNFGIGSYNTVREWYYLKESYDQYRPKMVIFEYTAGNDSALTELNDFEINRFELARRVKNVLRRLYSYDFIATRFYRIKFLFFSKKYSNEKAARLTWDKIKYDDSFQGWIETQQAFREINTFCKEKNAELIFAIYANNVNLAKIPEKDEFYPIICKVTNALEAAGINRYIVFDDEFRAYSGNERALWVNKSDSHFSQQAHKIAAEQLFEYLIEKFNFIDLHNQ